MPLIHQLKGRSYQTNKTRFNSIFIRKSLQKDKDINGLKQIKMYDFFNCFKMKQYVAE